MATIEKLNSASELIDLLNKQRFLYRQLHQLAQKQTSLVDGNDPEMLLKVLASRQRLIDKLTKIDKRLEPVRARWGQFTQSFTRDEKQQVNHLVENVQQILGEILSRDQKDSEKLHNSQQEVVGQMRSVSTGKRVNQLYSQTDTTNQSRYLDTLSG